MADTIYDQSYVQVQDSGSPTIDLLSDINQIIGNVESDLGSQGVVVDLVENAPILLAMPRLGFSLLVPAGYQAQDLEVAVETSGSPKESYRVESTRMSTWVAAQSDVPTNVSVPSSSELISLHPSLFTALSDNDENYNKIRIKHGDQMNNDYRQLTAIPQFSNETVANASLVATGIFGDPNDASVVPAKGIFVYLEDVGEIRMSQGDGTFGLGNTRQWEQVLGADEGAVSAVADQLRDSDTISLTIDENDEIRATLLDGYDLSNADIASLIERKIREAVIPPNNHDAFIGEFDPTTEAVPESGRYALAVDWPAKHSLNIPSGYSVTVTDDGVSKLWLEEDPALVSTYTSWDVSGPMSSVPGTYVASADTQASAPLDFSVGTIVEFGGGLIVGIDHIDDPVEVDGATDLAISESASVDDFIDGVYELTAAYQGTLGSRELVTQADIVEFENFEIIKRDHPTLPGHRSAFLHTDENGNQVLDGNDQELVQVHCQITATGERWVILKDGRDLMTRSEIELEFFSQSDASALEARLLPMVSAISPAWWSADGTYHNRLEAVHPMTVCKSGARGARITWWSEAAGTDTYWER